MPIKIMIKKNHNLMINKDKKKYSLVIDCYSVFHASDMQQFHLTYATVASLSGEKSKEQYRFKISNRLSLQKIKQITFRIIKLRYISMHNH